MPSKPETKPKYEFRKCLRKSQVLNSELLDSVLAEHEGDEPNEMASALVRKKLLTEWQAKYLLSGRYRLHLGNYQLLERIRRDDFGDRFIALHPQLGRTVQVQVLPVELTENSQQRSDFLKKAGSVGELDHPNLDHVFDIDKQQGRYYLVTEHYPWKPVSEFIDESRNATSVARIVTQAIAGLKYAHSKNVTHGRISSSNIFVSDDVDVKISQLALSPLIADSSTLQKENASPEQRDLLAVVRTGLRLLNRLESSDKTRQVSAILSKLNTKEQVKFTSAFSELESWVEEQSGKQIDDESYGTEPSVTQNNNASSSVVIMDEETRRLTNNARPPRSYNPERKKRRARDYSKLVSSAATAISLFLIASLISVGAYFAFRGFFSASDEIDVLPQQETVTQDATTRNSSESGNRGKVNSIDSPAQSTDAKDSSGRSLLSGVASRRDSTEAPKSFNSGDKRDVSGTTTGKFTSTNNAASEFAESDNEDNFFSSQSTSTESESKKSRDSLEPAATKTRLTSPSQSASTKTTQVPTESPDGDSSDEKLPTSAFEGFPTSIDLPPIDSIENKILATVSKSSIHLLGMELRSPEGVGKGRTNFTLQRSESNKQQWSLIAKKTPRSKGDSVGQFNFDKQSGQITFHWLAEAADSKIANYARNCVIKLSLSDESRTLALRTPLPLPELKLTQDKPFAQLDSVIDWLPAPEFITVELQPFKSAGLPKTWLEPAIVQPGSPSAVHFHEAASNRFMWLQLSTDIRNKASFELNLLLKHADGTVQPITRTEDLKKLANLLVQAAQAAEEEYLANVDVVAPYGQKTKFKDYVAKLKSTAKKTQRQAEIAAENIAIMENFYGKVIPLRVMFRTEGHQVVLVDTSPAAEKDETDE